MTSEPIRSSKATEIEPPTPQSFISTARRSMFRALSPNKQSQGDDIAKTPSSPKRSASSIFSSLFFGKDESHQDPNEARAPTTIHAATKTQINKVVPDVVPPKVPNPRDKFQRANSHPSRLDASAALSARRAFDPSMSRAAALGVSTRSTSQRGLTSRNSQRYSPTNAEAEIPSLRSTVYGSCSHVLTTVIRVLVQTIKTHHEYIDPALQSTDGTPSQLLVDSVRQAKLLYIALLEKAQKERGEWQGFGEDPKKASTESEEKTEEPPLGDATTISFLTESLKTTPKEEVFSILNELFELSFRNLRVAVVSPTIFSKHRNDLTALSLTCPVSFETLVRISGFVSDLTRDEKSCLLHLLSFWCTLCVVHPDTQAFQRLVEEKHTLVLNESPEMEFVQHAARKSTWTDPLAIDLLTVMANYRDIVFNDLEFYKIRQELHVEPSIAEASLETARSLSSITESEFETLDDAAEVVQDGSLSKIDTPEENSEREKPTQLESDNVKLEVHGESGTLALDDPGDETSTPSPGQLTSIPVIDCQGDPVFVKDQASARVSSLILEDNSNVPSFDSAVLLRALAATLEEPDTAESMPLSVASLENTEHEPNGGSPPADKMHEESVSVNQPEPAITPTSSSPTSFKLQLEAPFATDGNDAVDDSAFPDEKNKQVIPVVAPTAQENDPFSTSSSTWELAVDTTTNEPPATSVIQEQHINPVDTSPALEGSVAMEAMSPVMLPTPQLSPPQDNSVPSPVVRVEPPCPASSPQTTKQRKVARGTQRRCASSPSSSTSSTTKVRSPRAAIVVSPRIQTVRHYHIHTVPAPSKRRASKSEQTLEKPTEQAMHKPLEKPMEKAMDTTLTVFAVALAASSIGVLATLAFFAVRKSSF